MTNRILARRTVHSPDAREWDVGVRWLPRRPRWIGSRRFRGLGDLADGFASCGDFLDDLFIIFVVIAVLLLLIFLVLPAVVLLLDLLLILLLAGLGIIARVLFRRPWIVQATSDEERWQWPVVGTRAARRAVTTIADGLAAGLVPESIMVEGAGSSFTGPTS